MTDTIKTKRKRNIDKEKNIRLKEERARLDGFLNYLTSTPTRQEKIAMITKANPYHYILFKTPTNTGETL